ncbi:MAG TPA: prephenate dehydrogenase/arogenate dehydrogenase family protein, partial [Chthonomonadaceae bacterium]|nr:prephenate dehydrogenase/arogenate dehydrogenase family protein [Chthonomonadaceae bacterium]
MIFERVVIVGVGLMGGSLGLALKAHSLAGQVIGLDRSAEALTRAQARGAIDRGATDMEEAMRAADGIVIALPVGQIPALLEALTPWVCPDALVTDLGSVKAHIVEVGTRLLGARFVGGHPMAGSERSGIEA